MNTDNRTSATRRAGMAAAVLVSLVACLMILAARPAVAQAATVYTTNPHTTLYAKPAVNSAKITVWYNSKLSNLKVYKRCTDGIWYKLSYSGKTKYLWLTTGDKKFSTTKDKPTYKTYKKYCKTGYQRLALFRALNILYNWKTKYYHTRDGKYAQGQLQSDGTHGFDCSGFVSYVLNGVMQTKVAPFILSAGVDHLPTTKTICYDKYGAISAKTVCSGKLDYSKLQPGDVVFFACDENGNPSSTISHCAIYIGNKRMVHSTKGDGLVNGVCENPFFEGYQKCFVKAMRFLPTRTVSPINKQMRVKVSYGTKIYSNLMCNNLVTNIPFGTKVTVLYTAMNNNSLNAYVSYGNGKKGYIFNYKQKLY